MGSAVIFSGTKVKTLKSAIDLNGGNDIISSTTDPTSVAVSANIGSLLLNSSSGKLYRKNDSGSSTNWSEVGSGQSGINYISNPSAATNTTGWSTYAESDSVTFQDTGDTVTLNSHGLSNGTAVSFSVITTTTGISTNTLYYVVGATTNTFQLADTVGGAAKALTNNGSGTLLRSIPKLGTGGSANITWTRSTTTPLRGAADFEFNKDAANRMGQGVSTDFTIDNADLAKVLTISFDCEVVSGTYAAGDLDIFIIQDPSGTPVLIQPAGYVIQAGSVGTKVRQIATFQTDSSVKSYRLCIHASTVSASAYVVAADTVTVGPQVVQYGAPISDYQSYTPGSQGLGTLSNVSIFWRRVGSELELRGDFTTGTCTAVEARLNLPAGLTISSSLNNPELIGNWIVNSTTSVANRIVIASPSQTYIKFSFYDNASANGFNAANGSTAFLNSTANSFWARVPIEGWSSNTVQSADTDTRLVAAVVSQSAGQNVAGATETVMTFNTVSQDTHGSFASNKYTIPVSGDYSVSSNFVFGATAVASGTGTIYLRARVNGATLWNIGTATGGATASATRAVSGSGVIPSLKAGDYIEITIYQDTGTQLTTVGGITFTSFNRLSGPAIIQATDTVAARYNTSAGVSVSTVTPVNFSTKVFDSTNSVTTGASWKFTAPVSGTYLVSTIGAVSASAGDILLYKNGSSNLTLTSWNSTYQNAGSGLISLIAGDYIDIRASGALTTISNVSVHITRVGN